MSPAATTEADGADETKPVRLTDVVKSGFSYTLSCDRRHGFPVCTLHRPNRPPLAVLKAADAPSPLQYSHVSVPGTSAASSLTFHGRERSSRSLQSTTVSLR